MEEVRDYPEEKTDSELTEAQRTDINKITELVKESYQSTVGKCHVRSISADSKLTTYVVSVNMTGATALGLIVLSDEGKLSVYEDYAERVEGEENSVWRVDDEGEYHGSSALFGLRDKAGRLSLMSADYGAEEVTLYILTAFGDKMKMADTQWNFHTAPE
ncbi:hypothetical protein [Porphyromonas sp.]|uniref:hypothetical protein n=1 Tax=Porphyromonas sp. TaxID=1924944 RepID=UPI0026DD4F8C|nr:hypothetical protein [Porphyromonas sp.]MDO4771393.1 hypothetical protein [Porphyromonas sp.]